jgi:hypothetical protein
MTCKVFGIRLSQSIVVPEIKFLSIRFRDERALSDMGSDDRDGSRRGAPTTSHATVGVRDGGTQ